MRIKSRKQREKEYLAEYGDISIDLYDRIKNRLNGRLTQSLVDSLKNRLQDVNDNIKYNELRFIFYEKPVQAHRPRINYSSHIMYSPNAKENSKAIESFVESLKNSFSVIAVPMKIKLNAYYPMPKNINDLEFLIYELGLDYAIGKPDFDNVLKAYCDMLLRTIILDDDLIASAEFNKYFQLSGWSQKLPQNSDRKSIVFQIERKFYKCLPAPAFLTIFRIFYDYFIWNANRKSLKNQCSKNM